MRRLTRVLKWLALALLLVVLLTLGGGYLYLRQSLPQTSGTLSVSGISAPVEIIRDIDGVPHIYGQTKQDALFGLGYVHAQDRLWEMEIWRRITQGRFSEIFGELAIGQDRFLRTLGLQRAAQQAWERYPAGAKADINAYIAGVNAFLDGHSGADLPPEFTILGVTPERWSGVDALAWAKIFAFDLGSNYRSEILRDYLNGQVGPQRAAELMPGYPQDAPSILPDSQVSAYGGGLLRVEAGLKSLAGIGGAHGGAKGSNGWVVDGSKSASGKPVLANDPHLTMSLPGWYQAHLSAGDFDVIGASIPGLPGIVIGRNKEMAWGFTGLNPDVQDLYRERLDPSGRMAEFKGQWEPLQIITETIKVRGGADVQQLVRFSRHGPLLSDALNDTEAALPAELRPQQMLEPLALRWPALDPDDTSVLAFLMLNEAGSWQEVTQALSYLTAPGLSFLYADVQGNIGYYAATGHVPIRARGDGSLPVEGWSGDDEWLGWVPFEELPHAYNPPEHFVASANNRPVGDDYPFFLGSEWYPPYRAQRIVELLQAKPQLSPDDHAAIQRDTVSLQARELLPRLLALVTPQDEQQRQALALLAGWDGNTSGDSTAAAIYETWFLGLARAVAGDEIGQPLWVMRYEEDFTWTSAFLANTLQQRDSPWCDNVATPAREDCAQLAQETLRTTLAALQERLGSDLSAWRWDALHVSVIFHVPFQDVPMLQPFFSREIPTGGDWSTVNIGAFLSYRRMEDGRYENPLDFDHRFGASYRQIIDLGDPDGGRFIQTVGESGHLLSPHYDDYLEDWANGRHRPMRFTRAQVEQHAAATLRLDPAASPQN